MRKKTIASLALIIASRPSEALARGRGFGGFGTPLHFNHGFRFPIHRPFGWGHRYHHGMPLMGIALVVLVIGGLWALRRFFPRR